MGFELADSIYSKEKPLSQMRVAITAIDLEQAEHRGIAYLSKGLINSLVDLGAEVYLLTGFHGRRLNPLMKFSMSPQSVKEVDCADILDQFCDPSSRLTKLNRKKDLDLDEDVFTKLINKCIRFRNESKITIDLLFSVLMFRSEEFRNTGPQADFLFQLFSSMWFKFCFLFTGAPGRIERMSRTY